MNSAVPLSPSFLGGMKKYDMLRMSVELLSPILLAIVAQDVVPPIGWW
jgi:hypothetical protein